VLTVYGGVSIANQESVLRAGVDVVIGTTGRTVDLLNRGILSLSSLSCIVLDEADVMLDMGFQEDIEKVIV
jgi:superfamily II DNA/RNA helicase